MISPIDSTDWIFNSSFIAKMAVFRRHLCAEEFNSSQNLTMRRQRSSGRWAPEAVSLNPQSCESIFCYLIWISHKHGTIWPSLLQIFAHGVSSCQWTRSLEIASTTCLVGWRCLLSPARHLQQSSPRIGAHFQVFIRMTGTYQSHDKRISF